jgi:CRP-like cAMP-binding protein
MNRPVFSKGNVKNPKASGFDAHGMWPLAGTKYSYQPNQIIFRQGETANAIFHINKGKVQLTVVSERGKEGVIAILQDGDFFGEGCLSGQSLYSVSAIATTRSNLVRIEKKTMARMLHEDSLFAEIFLAFLLSRNLQIEADFVDLLLNSSEKRLARTLLILANHGKSRKSELVIPKINHETLAARVGTTRPRINFFMNKFRKLGLIDYKSGPSGLKVRSSLRDVLVHD